MNDLISRQVAIDTVCKTDCGACGMCSVPCVTVSTLMTLTPTEPRWIPVTERLPKLGEKVLVSTKNTVFTQVFKCIYGTPDRWGWEHHTIKKVTAWMPLPEPWKGEDE